MTLEVELKAFDGPLDLLLTLIEKNKINIFDIPIVEITDQYLACVRGLPEENLDMMSEFMVMASELLSIKCRMLLPREEEEEQGEEEDPRAELVRRLLEYKTYKYMSYELKDLMDDASFRLYKEETIPREVKKFRPRISPEELVGGMTLESLHDVFSQVLKRQSDKLDPMRSTFGTIEKEEVSLPDRLDAVTSFAMKHDHFSFRELLKKQKSRTGIVVTFLVVLELMSMGALRAEQEKEDGEIMIERVPDADIGRIRRLFAETEEY